MSRILALFYISIVANTYVFAQNGKLTGKISDKSTNHSVPFANIIIENSTNGTSSDSLGNFELNDITDEFIRIQISSIGYEPYISEPIRVSALKPTYLEFSLVPSSQSLEEVRVVSNPFVLKPESPLSVQTIGIDLIEKSAGANRDISKVLQSFPGVGSVVSFRNDLIVRGGGPSENRFYLDGIEIPTLNHFSTQGASGGPVGILNVDFIREVEFYSGSFPSARGNALSSVFEFSQIDGNSESATFKGSVGASELAMSINTHIDKKTTIIAGFRRSYLQFLFSQLGLPFLPTFNDFSFKTKTRFNEHNELTILGVGAIDQFKLNPSANTTEENDYILSYLPTNNQWNYTIGASYKHYFGNNYITLVSSRSHLNNTSYKYFNNIEIPENLNYDYKSNETENKFRFEITSRPGNFLINAGSNIEYAQYDNSTFSKTYTNSGENNITYQSNLNMFKWGFFGSASHAFMQNKLSISLGMRMDANNYSTDMNNLLDQLSPRFGTSYQLTKTLSINASVAKYYQLPAYTTLGYKVNDTYINKTNNLKYISANHFVMGFEIRLNTQTKISIEGFIKDYFNYPFSVNDSVSLASKGGDYGVFGDEEVTPTSKGKTSGFEVFVQQRSPNHLNYILAYTFVNSEFTDINNHFIASSWDSKHLFTATISKSFQKNWDIGLKWRYSGGLPFTPYDFNKSSYVLAWNARGREYPDYSKFNTKRLEPFHQMDVRVDKKYIFKNWTLGLYIDIQNLYNRKNQNPDNLVQVKETDGMPVITNPGAPINEQKYLLKPLQSTSGTVLPTIGLNIEF